MKKKIEKKKAISSPTKKKSVDTKVTGPENIFDFGGIPVRDLKKNLGC